MVGDSMLLIAFTNSSLKLKAAALSRRISRSWITSSRFALGGSAEPGNLRLLCAAHHRNRHADRSDRALCATAGPYFG